MVSKRGGEGFFWVVEIGVGNITTLYRRLISFGVVHGSEGAGEVIHTYIHTQNCLGIASRGARIAVER